MKLALLCLGLLHYGSSHPLTTLEDLEIADDAVSVGTYIREVRAAVPESKENINQGESDGEIGYSRKKEGGAKRGYQKFDTYRKKSGDNYAIAREDSFGYDDDAQEGAYSEKQEKKVNANAERKPEAKPERQQERQQEGKQESKQEHQPKYEDSERITHQNERIPIDKDPDAPEFTKQKHYAELKEGASDGNGGVEAYGHDRRDYILPEKYTWGKDDEYTF